jgi:preprotein translocase subunit SecG
MSILYILLTVVMFLNCVLLVFLVLLQLPKKEAGAGMAFGGAATDALFGAGSGNVLTKITKYAAGIFFGLAIILAIMASHKPQSGVASLAQKMMQGTAAPLTPLAAPPSTPPATPGGTGLLDLTNLPPAAPPAAGQPRPVSNAPAPPPAKGTNK